MLRKIFTLQFGTITVEELFRAIFILGLIPIILVNAYFITNSSNRSVLHMRDK